MDQRPVTANHVLTALAVLGCPATTQYVATDRHLPLLLGALLNVVEDEIADQACDPDRQDRVLDGFAAQSGPDSDDRQLSLAARRLDRTASEIDRFVGGVTPPASQLLELARQASRCADIALTVHLVAAEADGYRPTNQRLQAQLLTLGICITEMIDRFNEMVVHLDKEERAG